MDRLFSSHRVLSVLALSVIAGFALGLLLYSTPQGLGLNDDSIAYIAGARSLLSGQGYREIWLVSAGPVTHFPPGFPGTLAFLSLLTGVDPLRAARLLNGLLFALNTFLAGWLASRMTGSRLVGVLGAALFVLTPSFLRIHSNAMSEPLYIFFTLLVFLLLDIHFRSPNGSRAWPWLVAAGAFTGMAYLTRYAALALLATAIAAFVILSASWRERLARTAILLAGFLPWVAAWAVRNRMIGGSLTNRALGWHPITAENARIGIRTWSSFVVPVEAWQFPLLKVDGLFEGSLAILALVLLVWVLAAGLKRLLRRAQPANGETVSLLNGLYLFAYFLLLAATMTFFDPATKFQLRLVAPLFVSLLLMLAYGLYKLAGQGSGRVAGLLLAALILGVSAFGQGQALADLRRGGQVYANERWYDAPAIAALRELPADVAIHSNQPGVIYLYVGRPGSLLPVDETGVRLLQEQVRAGGAVIAIFKSAGVDAAMLSYYDSLGEGLASQEYNGDVIYSAP
jgi:4-amino-4-deoxy-L-arabinose transferase-like glycosyltransferase